MATGGPWPLLAMTLLLTGAPALGGEEVTQIHLEMAPGAAPRIRASAASTDPKGGTASSASEAADPTAQSTAYGGPAPKAEAIAFRWSWGRGPSRGGIYPILVDLHDLADEQLEERVIERTRADAPRFEACVAEALGREEPIADRAILKVVLSKDGLAHVVSMRMEGPHSTALKDCFWKIISPWRFDGLPPVDHVKILHLSIDKGRMADASPPPPGTPTPIDRSHGWTTLAGVEGVLPEGGEAWVQTLASWAPELSGCFESSWDHVDYACEGPLIVPLEIDAAGEIVHVWPPVFYSEGGEAPSLDPLIAALRAPPAAAEGERGEALDAGGEDAILPQATPAPDHLSPRCAPRVSPCLQNTLAIWQLPAATSGGRLTLRVMVHPPGRLEELPLPSEWGEEAAVGPDGDEGPTAAPGE